MKLNLNDAFPPTSDAFHNKILNTLEEVTTVKTRQRMPMLIVAVLVMAILLSGIALAAKNSELLKRLFYGREPSKKAEELLNTSGASITQEGVIASIEEYIHDGRTLTVSWWIENTTDAPVLIDGNVQLVARIGDMRLESFSGSGDLNMFTLVLGGSVKGNKIPSRQLATDTFEIPESLADQDVTLEFKNARIFKIESEIVSADEFREAQSDDWGGGKYTRNDAIVCDEWGRTEPYSYPGVAELVDKAWKEAGEPSYEHWEGERYDQYSAMAELGLIAPLAEFKVSETIQSQGIIGAKVIDGDGVFEQDGYTMRIEEAMFNAASSRLTMTIIPTPDGKYKDVALEVLFGELQYFHFLDASGDLLGGGLMGGGWHVDLEATDAAGNPCIRYSYHGDPIGESPDSVTIVRVDFGGDDYSGETDEEYIAFLKDHFVLDEAITIKFK